MPTARRHGTTKYQKTALTQSFVFSSLWLVRPPLKVKQRRKLPPSPIYFDGRRPGPEARPDLFRGASHKRSTTKQSTTKYYKVLRSTSKYDEVLKSTTKDYEVLQSSKYYNALKKVLQSGGVPGRRSPGRRALMYHVAVFLYIYTAHTLAHTWSHVCLKTYIYIRRIPWRIPSF